MVELSTEAGAKPAELSSVMDETGIRSHSCCTTLASLRLQAETVGLSLITGNDTWADYEDAFLDGLGELRNMAIQDGFFGDMRVEEHPDPLPSMA